MFSKTRLERCLCRRIVTFFWCSSSCLFLSGGTWRQARPCRPSIRREAPWRGSTSPPTSPPSSPSIASVSSTSCVGWRDVARRLCLETCRLDTHASSHSIQRFTPWVLQKCEASPFTSWRTTFLSLGSFYISASFAAARVKMTFGSNIGSTLVVTNALMCHSAALLLQNCINYISTVYISTALPLQQVGIKALRPFRRRHLRAQVVRGGGGGKKKINGFFFPPTNKSSVCDDRAFWIINTKWANR